MNNENTTATAQERGKGPKPVIFRIRIDRDDFEVPGPTITGRELLVLAGKTPIERYAVYSKVKGTTERIDLDQVVDLTRPGLERFVTLPLDQTEG
jgi:hypothetical protein